MNIIITGASRGIGYELTRKFIENGHQVVAIARNIQSLILLKEELASENLFILGFDLTNSDYKKNLIPIIEQQIGRVDVLINNAGLLVNKPISKLSDEDFDQSFAVNVKSPFRLVRDILPLFNQNAHVLNISSMGGVQGSAKFPGLSIYSASKAALAVLTECLAEELKPQSIKANALAIGAVQTEMLESAFPGYQAPLTASEMADYILDFALTGHQFYNGKILPVSMSTP